VAQERKKKKNRVHKVGDSRRCIDCHNSCSTFVRLESGFLDLKDLNHREAAEFVKLSPGRLYDLNFYGDGPPKVRKGQNLFYRKEDLKKWNEKRIKEKNDKLP